MIITTYINEDELPQECVLNAASIYNKSADSTKDHFKKYVKEFINLKSIKAICIDCVYKCTYACWITSITL